MRDTLDDAFALTSVTAKVNQYHELISPFVVGPEADEAFPYSNTTQAAFEASLTSGDDALLPHIQARHRAVEQALAQTD